MILDGGAQVKVGDKVEIVGGPLDGEEATVQAVSEGVVHCKVAGEKELISIVPDVDCKPAAKTPR